MPQIIIVEKKRLLIPIMSNIYEGNNSLTSHIRKSIITIENKLNVISRMGRVIKESIGLIKNNNNPVTAPTSNIVFISPS